jgi:Leucine-rich repeat (LRR) protein
LFSGKYFPVQNRSIDDSAGISRHILAEDCCTFAPKKNIIKMKKTEEQPVLYPKISFRATTIEWSYGGIVGMRIGTSSETSFYVKWGDGRQDKVVCNKGVILQHSYYHCLKMVNKVPPKNKKKLLFPNAWTPYGGISFHVEIFSDDENCRIIEFGLTGEMSITELNLNHCVELETLSFAMKDESTPLDLSKNTELRYLDCHNNRFAELDVSNNTKLVELYCHYNKIRKLDLSNNQALRILDCTNNGMCVLFVWYSSQLKNASFTEGNNIDNYAANEIMEIVESNIPVKDRELYKGSPGYIPIMIIP